MKNYFYFPAFLGFLLLSSNAGAQTILSGTYEGAIYNFSADSSPYLVADSAIFNCNYIAIESGVVISFKYHASPEKKSYMRINGALDVINTLEDAPIIFTSARDNRPFDLNGDGTASRPGPGDWGYVYFGSPFNDNHLPLINAQFRYGGGRVYGNETDTKKNPMVVVSDYNEKGVYDSRLRFEHCTFSNSAGVGILAGMVDLSSVEIFNCAYGIRLITSDAYIYNSVIRNNKIYPVFLTDPTIKRDGGDDFNTVIESFSKNEIYKNGLDVIALEGKLRCAWDGNNSNVTTELMDLQFPYLITNDLVIDSLTLEIEAGTLLKFLPESYAGKPININFVNSATLNTQGTENKKVVFTSLFDYKYDKVPPRDQNLRPSAGDWGIITGENPQIRHTIFKYGGKYTSPHTQNVVPDSSAVIHITRADQDNCLIDSSIFTDLYQNGILVLDSAIMGGQTNIHGNSFLLDKDGYGIFTLESTSATDSMVNATGNYWNGKLGPYHSHLNNSGNGCMVGDYIDFKPFQPSSDDATNLLTSVIRGVVMNDKRELLNNALVELDSKNPKLTYTNEFGQFYLSDVRPGEGYKLSVMANAHHQAIIEPLNVPLDTSLNFNFELEQYTIDYAIDTINFNINPEVSVVAEGGTAHRYYKIIDIHTGEPVHGAKVLISNGSTFDSNSEGIVDIAIPSSKITGNSETFYIQRIGIETVDLPEDKRETFEVRVKPYSYHKIWSGSTFLTVGVSGFEGKKLNGAALDLHIKNNSPDSIRLVRQSQTGFGYALKASSKATLGPAEAGAEAGVGINMNLLLEDDFNFDYPNPADGKLALSKFIVLADGALPYMDAPLIRYFVVALEKEMDEIEAAAVGNSVGMNIHAFASAGAGIDFFSKDTNNFPLSAALKGSASVTGDITYMAKEYSHRNPVTGKYPVDHDFHAALELSVNAEAGAGVYLNRLPYLRKLFSKAKISGVKADKVESKLPLPLPDEDLQLELVSANASGGVKFGTHFGTTRFVPSPYCRMGFLYGFKYSYGAGTAFTEEVGQSLNREFTYNFDVYDDNLVEMVRQSTDLAHSMLSPENIIDLNISDLSTGNFFNNPMNKIAELQSRNAFTIAPVPYQKTVKERVGEGGFNIIIDAGAGPVSAKFGAGFNYAEDNKYLKENGVFYKWDLYPMESYEFLEENVDYNVKPIIQDIVSKSATYLKNEISEQLRPRIFRRTRLWSRWSSLSLKSANDSQEIPIGPESRASYLSFSDSASFSNIEGIDSMDVVYWDWYGTGDDNATLKKAVSPNKLALYEYVKKSSQNVHKLDYGIGGFYQFEPYNTSVAETEVFVTINYFDTELTVMLSDSSITTIDENELRMYKEDKERNRWVYIGGVVDTANNTVTARIDSFGTFTLAPFVPNGDVKLFAAPDTIRLENTDTTKITSDQIFYNTDEIIADGELFTMKASRGSFLGTDADTIRPDFQVASSGGIIQVIYKSNELSGDAYVIAESVKGDAAGKLEIYVTDTVAPVQPILTGAELQDKDVRLWWTKNNDKDIVKYQVQYDTISGGPYNGVASVYGEPSPVDAGLDSVINISGLDKGKTYYFVINAVDRSGNISANSNELSIVTEFNHRPVFYHKIIHIEPDLPNGTVIDTLKATDEDVDQVLTFFFSETNTEDAFALDPATGILSVNNQERLNYFVTRIDTFLLHVGAKDDAVNSASDEGLVMVVLDIETWVPKYKAGHNARLELFPNPAQDHITLKLGDLGFSKEIQVDIYTITGENCYSSTFHHINQNELKVQVQSLESGYYLIDLRSEKGKRSGSFVILK